MSVFKILIDWPLLGLVPAAVFFALAHYNRRRIPMAAAYLWAAYAVYEFLVQRGVLCVNDCNGRLDLLFIEPALVVVSVVALFSSLRGRKEIELQ